MTSTTYTVTANDIAMQGGMQIGATLMVRLARWGRVVEAAVMLVEYPGEPDGGFRLTPRRPTWLLRLLWPWLTRRLHVPELEV